MVTLPLSTESYPSSDPVLQTKIFIKPFSQFGI
jgi:hypothetical protein